MLDPSPLEKGAQSLEPDIRSTLLGAQAQVQLFDGTRLQGLIEAWQEDALLLKPAVGSARNLSLHGVRTVQLDAQCAAAPTQTAYQTYRIRFRDDEVLDGSCLDAAIHGFGIQLFTEALDGSPLSMVLPAAAVQQYCIGQREGAFTARSTPASANPVLPAHGLLSSAAELQAVLAHPQPPSCLASDPSGVEGQAELPEAVHLARRLGIPALRLQHFDIDPAVTALVPEALARRYHLMPVLLYEGRLVVALANPADEEVLRLLRFTEPAHRQQRC